MHLLHFFAVVAGLLMVAAQQQKGTGETFSLTGIDCGPYGTEVDRACHCAEHFHVSNISRPICDVYHSRRCTQDKECGEFAFCLRKNFLQCRLTGHCKPSGWCVPMEPMIYPLD